MGDTGYVPTIMPSGPPRMMRNAGVASGRPSLKSAMPLLQRDAFVRANQLLVPDNNTVTSTASGRQSAAGTAGSVKRSSQRL